MVEHQQVCRTQSKSCHLNSVLLQYFIQRELIDKNTSEVASQDQGQEEEPHEDDQIAKTPEQEPSMSSVIEPPKQVMKITKCPHVNRKHYAKNMCSSCYRKYGRN